MKQNPVVLFDGVCNLCNKAVQFIIQRDKNHLVKFSALQSETGRRLQQEYGLPPETISSIILIADGKAYTQSTAALKLCKYLTALWPLLYGFIIVPTFIRDGVYRWVAKNRYQWFGRQDHCMIPTPELKNRFLQ